MFWRRYRVYGETDEMLLMQFSFDVSRSAMAVDSCDRRRPSAGSAMIGSSLELVGSGSGSLKSHVFKVRSSPCHDNLHLTRLVQNTDLLQVLSAFSSWTSDAL